MAHEHIKAEDLRRWKELPVKERAALNEKTMSCVYCRRIFMKFFAEIALQDEKRKMPNPQA